MSKNDEYQANAAECERMAQAARDESERRTWRQMADSWLRKTAIKSSIDIGGENKQNAKGRTYKR
jgi:hypothetical protein